MTPNPPIRSARRGLTFLIVALSGTVSPASGQILPNYSVKPSTLKDPETERCQANAQIVTAYAGKARTALRPKAVDAGGYISFDHQRTIEAKLYDLESAAARTFGLLRGPGRVAKCSGLQVFFNKRIDAVMQAVFKGKPYEEQYLAAPYLTDPNLPSRPWLGLRLANRARQSAGQMVNNRGVQVTEVIPGEAAFGQIEVGDILLAIDNWATDSEQQAAAASAAVNQSGAASANLILRKRSGDLAMVTLTYRR